MFFIIRFDKKVNKLLEILFLQVPLLIERTIDLILGESKDTGVWRPHQSQPWTGELVNRVTCT